MYNVCELICHVNDCSNLQGGLETQIAPLLATSQVYFVVPKNYAHLKHVKYRTKLFHNLFVYKFQDTNKVAKQIKVF